MAISPDGTLVAFYLDSSELLVADLGTTLAVCMQLDFSARAATLGSGASGGRGEGDRNQVATLPLGMVWLDNSSVALQWRNFVVIVDKEKNVYELFYPSFVHMQPEASYYLGFVNDIWFFDSFLVFTLMKI